ncbi:MAG: hypothetical protein IKV87_05495 [Methanobrevibacter sp.]|nr:hypothetical protein [Methanobrevibacter sp.]
MTFEKNNEKMYVKNAVDYVDLNSREKSSNQTTGISSLKSSNSSSDSDLSSIDKKIIDILNFCDDQEGDSSDSNDFDLEGVGCNIVDNLDNADLDNDGLDEELDLLCSLGICPFEEENDSTGIDKDSFADYFNPAFENHPDELAMLSFFNDFVLVELSFDDLIREVYFEE